MCFPDLLAAVGEEPQTDGVCFQLLIESCVAFSVENDYRIFRYAFLGQMQILGKCAKCLSVITSYQFHLLSYIQNII